MPHLRHRYLTPLVKKGLTHKGVVGIFGHRQVGKTTLIEGITNNYTTLDSTIQRERANSSPASFVSGLCELPKSLPAAIDECQLAPPLFPEIKEYIRTHKKPGQLILSGSVRFSSRKAIRESLTGRMLSYELLPFSISELEEKPINRLVLELLHSKGFQSKDFASKKALGFERHSLAKKYLTLGGLPGICFVRDSRDRKDLIESQLDLILDRDLRLVCETEVPLPQLRSLARLIAQNQNKPLNFSEISRKSRISTPTLKKIIRGLESIFFVRILSTHGNESRPVVFLEDQGEATYLAQGTYDEIDDLERICFAHIRVPLAYEPGLSFEIHQYRQQGGAYLPFMVQSEGNVLGFMCSTEEKPSLGAIRSADSFKKNFPGAKVVHLHTGTRTEIIAPDEMTLPIELIF